MRAERDGQMHDFAEPVPSVDIGPISVVDAHRLLGAHGWVVRHTVMGREFYMRTRDGWGRWDLDEALRDALGLEDV
jgi:hypothetical protein